MVNGCLIPISPLPLGKYAFIFGVNVILKRNRDSFDDCVKKNVWGDLKILLLDTIFWATLSVNPEKYNEKYRSRVKLLECDFVVMPMFES